MDDLNGRIFNVQRFCVHDGPGIRTTVFFKGCPLSCRWCPNPEGLALKSQIVFRSDKCNGCRKCIDVCREGAIIMKSVDGNHKINIDWEKCNDCLLCADECIFGAIGIAGRDVSIEEIIDNLIADWPFYQNSGGGVTASGGEPLAQWKFVKEMFKILQRKGIHTALDTSGYAPWETFDEVLNYTSLVLYDLKHMDNEIHKKMTGKENSLILANAEKTANRVETWFRVPLIPGVNDSKKNLKQLAEFVNSTKAKKISLLTYHELGIHKYKQIGKKYPLKKVAVMDEDKWVKSKMKVLEEYNLTVTINY